MQAEAAAAGVPLRPRRVVPEAAVERPREPAVVALEQAAGVAAGVEDAVGLALLDHPDPRERGVAVLGQRDALRLLPLAARVVGDQIRPP